MPDHGSMSMSMSLLPGWLAWAWAVALAGVAALHLQHVRAMTGRVRGWHLAHVVMAVGMITMYLLGQPTHPSLYRMGDTAAPVRISRGARRVHRRLRRARR